MSTLNATEVGKTIRFITLFDMSARTSITIKITSLTTGNVVTVSNARINLSPTPIVSADYGEVPGNQYAMFNTEATDFPIPGDYELCLTYVDATPRTYYSNHQTKTVGKAC